MKIKTITAQTPTEFDKAVNAALDEGYVLKRRGVLPPCEVGMDVYPRIYYAELEMAETRGTHIDAWRSMERPDGVLYGCPHCGAYVQYGTKNAQPPDHCHHCHRPLIWTAASAPPEKHGCYNCRHCEAPGFEYPCTECDDGGSRWEAEE